MKKKYIFLLFFVGFIGLWLTFSHIFHFTFPTYFYNNNPEIEKYIGINVVSKYADFSFFTYHTIILFSVWCILVGISELFKLQKLNNFIRSDGIMSFIFMNYVVTTSLYTIFEFTSGNPTFGYYGLSNLSIHNMGTNIIAHYLLFVICLLCFILIPSKHKVSNKIYIFISIYLLLYFVIVKITGMYCYVIEWYPYIIFDSDALGSLISSTNTFINVMLLIIINIVIYLGYIFGFKFLKKIKK